MIIFGVVLFLGIPYVSSTFAVNQNASFNNQTNISEAGNGKEPANELILISDVIENRLLWRI